MTPYRLAGGDHRRLRLHAFLIPLTLAAMLAGPVAAASVLADWWQMLPEARPDDMSGALWAARLFIVRFDAAVVLLSLPCHLVFTLWRQRALPPVATGTLA